MAVKETFRFPLAPKRFLLAPIEATILSKKGLSLLRAGYGASEGRWKPWPPPGLDGAASSRKLPFRSRPQPPPPPRRLEAASRPSEEA
ncbi:hypothetical protein DRO53_00435 [Candidatus Bathyarchaeota archaeon]|nr:MAG: hypothetical protein DRO53_00435 [Candidatus Bathyarchaeota archaeon]